MWGGKVELINANGELEPAPDGDYEMESGARFTVKDGLIASIEGEDAPEEEAPAEEPAPVAEEEAAEPAEEEAPAEEPQEEKVDEVAALKERMAQMEEMIAAMGQAIEDLKGSAATKDEMNQFAGQVQQLDQNFQILAKVPVQMSKTTTNNQVKQSNEEKLIELAKLLRNK